MRGSQRPVCLEHKVLHRELAEALSKEDHKAAIEKLKAEMAAKREEAQRRKEEERRIRLGKRDRES